MTQKLLGKSIVSVVLVGAILFAAVAPVSAQVTYMIWGQVFDTDGSTGVEGVTVTVTDLDVIDPQIGELISITTTSLADGWYQVVFGPPKTNLSPTLGDQLQFVATYDGKSNTTTVEATGNGQRVDLILQAGPEPPNCTVAITNTTIVPPMTTDIYIEFSERVIYQVNIENSAGTSVYWYPTTPGERESPLTITWDGTYKDNTTVVPDDVYTVNVTMESTATGLKGFNNTEIITVTTVLPPDETAPETTYEVTPEPNAEGWNNVIPVNVTFFRTDPGYNPSGVNYTNWSTTNETGPWTKVDGNESFIVSIDAEGETTIWFFSVDKNATPRTETTKNLTVQIDLTKPVVTSATAEPDTILANAVNTSLLNVTATDAGGSNITNVTVNISAIGGSAAQELTYNDTAGAWQYATTATVVGNFSLPVMVLDAAGNFNDSATITLNTTAPVHNSDTGENFLTIQAAIDAANTTDGHTITVDSGAYTENVNVTKQLTITSTSGDSANTIVQALDTFDPVFLVTRDNVTISGFTVTGSEVGIFLNSSGHCTISNNNASGNEVGIGLEESNNNTISNNDASNNEVGIGLYASNDNMISNNNASNNRDEGIGLYASNNNTISNNNASNNEVGIVLEDSNGNTISDNEVSGTLDIDWWTAGIELGNSNNNTLTNNTVSDYIFGSYLAVSNTNTLTNNTFWNDGLFVWDSYNNTVEDNRVNGKPLVYLEEAVDQEITTNAGQIVLVNCDNITGEFEGTIDVSNASVGVEFWGTNNSKLKNIDSSNNLAGILLFGSSGNIFTDITALNVCYGIDLEDSSNNNTFTDITASRGLLFDGAEFYSDESSHNNEVEDLTMSSYPTTISFTYDNGLEIYSVEDPEPDPVGKGNIGKYLEAYSWGDDSWLDLKVHYSDPDDIENIDEASLKLYHWCETHDVWEEIPGSTVNTTDNYVSANVTDFSQIAPFGSLNYGVDLNVDVEEQRVDPSVNATYEITVTNVGINPDNYTLTIDNPNGASVTISQNKTADIDSGNSTTVIMTVSSATAGTFPVNVTATSASYPAAADSVNTTTYVYTQVLSTITVSPATSNLLVGETQLFTATAYDQGVPAWPMKNVTINWSSSDIVGTVNPEQSETDQNGEATTTFTALAAGTTTIKAENGTVNGTVDVTVTVVQYNLMISSTAGGTVTGPGEGTFTYAEGTSVNLKAVPDAGYEFVSWTGDISTIVGVNAKETTITMNDNYTITANFKETYIGGGGGRGGPAPDSDGDGYSDLVEWLQGSDPNDPCDPDPTCAACLATKPTAAPTAAPTAPPTAPPPVTTPTTKPPAATPTPTPKEPGFGAVFAIAGLLAVAYLVLRRKK